MLEIKAQWQGNTSDNLRIVDNEIIVPFPNLKLPIQISFGGFVKDEGSEYSRHATYMEFIYGNCSLQSNDNVILGGKNIFDWTIEEFANLFHELQPVKPPYKSYKPIALLNCSIITADGDYRQKTVSLDWVRETVSNNETISAIGHDSTAQILSDLLGSVVPVNRIQFEQQPGQDAIVFKLNGRAPEGKILSREEIETIGYSFKLLERLY